MRITTDRWTSRLSISHLLSLGLKTFVSVTSRLYIWIAAMMIFVAVPLARSQSTMTEAQQIEQKQIEERVKNTLKKTGETIRFLENKGQIPNRDVLYYYEGPYGSVYVEPGRIRFVAVQDTLIEDEHHEDPGEEEELFEEEEETRYLKATHTFSIYLDHANLNPTIRLGESFTTRYNYFIGQDPANWASC